VTLLLLTTAFAYCLDSIFVGALFALSRHRYGWRWSKWQTLLALLVVFIVLDVYWLPAATVADARLTIGNGSIAEVLGIAREFSLVEFFSLGWLDIFVWSGQVILAVRVAKWFGKSLSVSNP
jgi:hypothetical protein